MLSVILYRITEPVLSPLRRIIPRAGMVDFTPLVAIILLQLIAYLLPWMFLNAPNFSMPKLDNDLIAWYTSNIEILYGES